MSSGRCGGRSWPFVCISTERDMYYDEGTKITKDVASVTYQQGAGRHTSTSSEIPVAQ